MYQTPIELSEFPEIFESIKNTESYKRTSRLIEQGKRVKNIVKRAGYPSGKDCNIVKGFLLDVENWKFGMEGGDCKKFYRRYIESNDASFIITSITHVHNAVRRGDSDIEVLGHLNHLKGMGSVREGNDTSGARQKLASSVLRLLYPERYGVVDWRVEAVITGATGTNSSLRRKFDLIDANKASDMFAYYRSLSTHVFEDTGINLLPGDIESVLFHISLDLYPPQNA
ncbi:TPA: hypothetical protein ACGGSM_003443 [Vibrio cholerae]